MTREKKPQKKRQESVFQEAWRNMAADVDRLLPDKLRRKDKKQFVLWLFIVELVVLGAVGTAVYQWWKG